MRVVEPRFALVRHDLVAVDKPAGIAVIPARGEAPEASLVKLCEAHLGRRLWVVHRIDRETSGLVLFALDAETHRDLNAAFEARAVEKEYVGYSAGRLIPDTGAIDLALHSARRGRMRPAAPGEAGSLAARTEYALERAFRTPAGPVSRLSLRPRTGRQHQIRVHLRARETPLLFDAVYGRGVKDAFAAAPCGRLALHARRLRVDLLGDVVEAEAPPPDDLQALDAWLASAEASA
jgi:23S rRNA-/tRNA-specific pseudouridylate synthase